jgi:hypothetical protein
MNSRLYYRTTYGQWKSQAANFVQSHLIPCSPADTTFLDATPVVVYVEASEGSHMALESDQAWHQMSLLVSGSTLCSACVASLSSYGITSQDNMFNAGKKLGATSPGLKPSRF